ncbi:MAG TPA: SprT family zinc-dependent metalloprotease [Novimethylophilus sp.]|jgi:hypothetical protein|uniref:M48 family metallopeptidase n=1 Tax=Novimethylophilus sp. TaxID=2137426 RepID=UPI002F3F22DF
MEKLLQLPTGPIPYTLKVSANRRTIGLRIDERGLTVHIPKCAAWSNVEKLLHEKSAWILSKLALRERAPAPMEWTDGAPLLHLGQDIRLCLHQDARNRMFEFDGATLYISQPNPNDTAAVQRKVTQWYRKQALADFTRRIELLAAKLGVTPTALFLSSAKTRWGSCNSKGEIRLHWRLIQAPPHIIHYVVAHELAHLKEMNHSPKFWAWVEKLCPNYSTARQELKVLSAQLHLV